MKKKNLYILVFFITLFIAVRSIHFSDHLNFSFDQAWGSTRTLEIWRNKEITLVGPGNSLVINGKQILQGSINYYFPLIFLLFGRFDPVASSLAFMIFAALMLIPLYYGVKYLAGRTGALLIISLYSLLPLFIDFTRFFFGPNFQLSLLPLVVLFMGLYRKTHRLIFYFLIFMLTGIESQFHYGFLLIFIILFFYYSKMSFWQAEGASRISKRLIDSGPALPAGRQARVTLIILPIIAFIIGFSPIIVFELKNNFYNARVFIEYLQQGIKPSNFALTPHRYLSLSLLLLVFFVLRFKKYINIKFVILISLFLFILDIIKYFPKPKQAFGMVKNWNYLMEKKAYQIIKKENLADYNIANLIYDNLSVVIKYQLKLDRVAINYDDYYHNKYLFVIDKNENNISKNPAYEIKTFFPRIKLKQWKLNDYYNLYLFERIQNIRKK